MSYIETMQARQSIRTFETRSLSAFEIEQISTYIHNEENLIGPFGGIGKIYFVLVKNNVTDKGIKLGTYGFIKNPQAYLVGSAKNEKLALVEYAYIFHRLVLYLTKLGLGTCWMGGTFSRNSFEKEIQLIDDEFIPCVTPLGYPTGKQRIFDKALRYVVKADNKKRWDQIFFHSNFEEPLSKEKSGSLEIPIEMVRIGPSASNKQPWRLVLSEDQTSCYFNIEHTPNYSSKLGYDMQLLDIGIAMCQFELACLELQLKGSWVVADPQLNVLNENTEYVVTWNVKK
ncbi:nitroreductase family protein [Halalkalibacter akibai]|uniref:Nitroreductase family protein n=1 Tax=Halalkalibacter akibai (strain ATCC 43226 / DSM 21942 / CIP 109018 / JCM 9157 / 1139) TaxID=1236973 RepID=W4QYY9_HALA3|nr:nitroreductase family protein [Halalkalibacter akibai]GAE37122.1 nitroreductase family protein [Halalkalibacter akibai JCM 9157]